MNMTTVAGGSEAIMRTLLLQRRASRSIGLGKDGSGSFPISSWV